MYPQGAVSFVYESLEMPLKTDLCLMAIDLQCKNIIFFTTFDFSNVIQFLLGVSNSFI